MTSVIPSLFSYSPSQVPIFDGEHYEYWSSQMQTFFISQDLWDIIEDGYPELPETETDTETKTSTRNRQAIERQYKENRKRDASTLRYIQQGVSKSIFPRIFGVKIAKSAWEILKVEFEGSEKAISLKLQSLWKDFDNLAMKESESVRDFSS